MTRLIHQGAARADRLPMTAAQTASLRRLAHEAFEPEAFRPHLTQAEAMRRIAMLRAKMELQDEPPHTL